MHLILPPPLSGNVGILTTPQRCGRTYDGHAPADRRASGRRRTSLQLLPLLTSVHARESACMMEHGKRIVAMTVSQVRTTLVQT